MWECVVTAGWEKSLEKQNKTNHPQPPQRKIQENIFIEEAQKMTAGLPTKIHLNELSVPQKSPSP